MVNTRRASGKLPPLAAASSDNIQDSDEDEFGGYESLTTDITDSDDDFNSQSSGEVLLLRYPVQR
jgi:hypothetical protein